MVGTWEPFFNAILDFVHINFIYIYIDNRMFGPADTFLD